MDVWLTGVFTLLGVAAGVALTEYVAGRQRARDESRSLTRAAAAIRRLYGAMRSRAELGVPFDIDHPAFDYRRDFDDGAHLLTLGEFELIEPFMGALDTVKAASGLTDDFDATIETLALVAHLLLGRAQIGSTPRLRWRLRKSMEAQQTERRALLQERIAAGIAEVDAPSGDDQ